MVTLLSLGFVLLAMWLFSIGWFGPGLIAAWIMTFLDTVDGKLARVTVTSTTFGNFFDHGIDIVGPPVWYVAWAYGLPEGSFGIDRVLLLE
ncbi:MAG: CDP-alcohol phosphatidyltransferase family protein, partial [Candidatus Binatia bacterium]